MEAALGEVDRPGITSDEDSATIHCARPILEFDAAEPNSGGMIGVHREEAAFKVSEKGALRNPKRTDTGTLHMHGPFDYDASSRDARQCWQ